MKQLLLFLTLLLILGACQSNRSIDQSKQKSFFDLKGFFESEIKNLTSKNPLIKKTIHVDTETESQSVKIEDWQSELQLFQQADINKPAWIDSYQIDSLIENNQLKKLTYTAIDPDLRVQFQSITFDTQKKAREIIIQKSEDNPLYESNETLTYLADKSYSIEQFQDVLLLSPKNFKVEAIWK